MADYKVGQCNYCGKYRELKYYGGYCCKSCYQKSGQAATDAKYAQDKEELWYERDDVFAVLIRTVFMTFGWMLFIGLCERMLNITIFSFITVGVIAIVVSLLQNFIMRDKEKPFRCVILYGIPIVLFLILRFGVVGHLNKVKAYNKELLKNNETSLQYADWARLKGTSGLTEEKIEKELVKTLKKSKDIDNGKIKSDFDKWYSSDYNCFVAQEYSYYAYSLKEQKLKPKSSVLFDNNGLAFDKYKYYPGAALKSEGRELTVEFNPKTKRSYSYWKDGTVIYNLPGEVYVKKDAVFNSKNATEVIGKTFSGKWVNVKDKASITFGNDGVATVVLPDGKKTKGAYFASDEDNMVVYNHNNEGIWYSFHYYDYTPLVSFYAYDEDLTKFKEIGVMAWKKMD